MNHDPPSTAAPVPGTADRKFRLFFPPADSEMEATLWKSVERLAPLAPPVCLRHLWRGRNSTRERTHNVVTRIQRETPLVGAPHLTCIGASRGEVLDIARKYWDRESAIWLRFVAILHGGQNSVCAAPDGFAYASDLVAGLKSVPTSIFPLLRTRKYIRKHLRRVQIWNNLKRKLDAGASRASRNFFYYPMYFCASAIAAKPLESSRRSCRESCDHPLPAGVEVRGHVRCDGAGLA